MNISARSQWPSSAVEYRSEIEREKFYPRPGIEPRPLALRASALPLCHLGQLLIKVELISLSQGPQTL